MITLRAAALLAGLLAWPGAIGPDSTGVAATLRQSPDEQAIEIALRSLSAVRDGWALARYDAARRVRASVNLRGGGSTPVGLTANVVVDRPGGRYRLDAAGDIGPLTLVVDAGQALLYVSAVEQFARQPAGALDPGLTLARSLAGEIQATMARLEGGYDGLRYSGQETVGGAPAHRLVDSIGPGETATYWIDAATYLPRRVVVARPGRDTRISFLYDGGSRPARIEALLRGPRYVEVSIVPGYDPEGRVARLHLESRDATGSDLTIDVNLDWSPRIGAEHFRFSPPEGAREVPFSQLVSGVAFSVAGKLGALLPLFTGWS